MVGVPEEEAILEVQEAIKPDYIRSMSETLISEKAQEQTMESMELLPTKELIPLWRLKTAHGDGSSQVLAGSTSAAPTALMLEPHLAEEVLITVVVLLVLILKPEHTKSIFQTCISEKVQELVMRKTDSARREYTLSLKRRVLMAILGDD